MTRGMLMTVLASLGGADTSGGNPWYAKGLDWAVKNGVSDGTLAPKANATRAQLAAILMNFCQNVMQ